eukprot:228787-Prorocentrum_lima.AAC.1
MACSQAGNRSLPLATPSVYCLWARNWFLVTYITLPSSVALARAMVESIKAVTCSLANVPIFRVS